MARAASAVDVRFGSKADMCDAKWHVRFAPNSGHVRCKEGCPLCANSGHSCLFSYQGRQPRQLRCIGPANAQRIDRTLLD